MRPETVQNCTLSRTGMNHINPTVTGDQSTKRLAIYLIGVIGIAGIYSWLHMCGSINFGLGWSIQPGFSVLTVTLILALLSIRTIPWTRHVFVFACLIGAIVSEFMEMPRPYASLIVFGLGLVAAIGLMLGIKRVHSIWIAILLLCSYIQSVAIYNLFREEQMMFFFRPGWTL
jgi:hypothetical protein